MLRLRLTLDGRRESDVVSRLAGMRGVERLTSTPAELPEGGAVVSADVSPSSADGLIALLSDQEIPSGDYVLVREDVVSLRSERTGTLRGSPAFAWIEILGEARENARPIARYLALIAAAGWIAALGVITANVILIVGAMAISPDLLPICASCVGLVGRRGNLTRRSIGTLVIGMALVICVAALVGVALEVTGVLGDGYTVGAGGVGDLARVNYTTVMIALAAGVAAMLSFESRSSNAVGVAISVTTIPASAYFGVALGVGEAGASMGALLVLLVNVVLLVCSGTLTLILQRRFGVETPRSGV